MTQRRRSTSGDGGPRRRAGLRLSIAAAVAAALTVADPQAGPVTGLVRTQVRAGTVAATPVVYAEPLDAASPRVSRRFTMAQKNKTFQPRVLAVPQGSTVDFPNNDPIHHNVFSLSGTQPFDLGLYRSGETRARTFTQPGVYRVFCNIHPQMSAFIVVAPSAYTTLAANDGRFTLDLPAGRYRLTAMSERADAVTAEMTSVDGAVQAPVLALDESSWAFRQHQNKFGQNYPAAAYTR